MKKLFICPIRCCRRVFDSDLRVSIHVKRIHENDPMPFKCSVCAEGFGSKRDMDRHINRIHRDFQKLDASTESSTKSPIHCQSEAEESGQPRSPRAAQKAKGLFLRKTCLR